MTARHVSLEETVVELLDMTKKLGAASVEFGFIVEGPDPDRDPNPDEFVMWWAKAHHRGGPVWIAEHPAKASDPTGHIEVLAQLCRRMGATVRLRWEEGPPGGEAKADRSA
jgi:hypothetical protein